MKLHKFIFVIFACAVCFFTACDSMTDLHISYLEEGEKIYAAKVDSVSPGSGNMRVNMEVFIHAQRIDIVRIYWNAYQDSIDYTIGGKTGVFNIMIENLQEREYLFHVVSFDKYGNRSLAYECSSLAYGENYRNTLANRRIESITKTAEGAAVFKWAIIADDAESTSLTYTDEKGKSAVRTISTKVETDTIANFKPGSEFSYFTIYRPAKNSPDTFSTVQESGTMPE